MKFYERPELDVIKLAEDAVRTSGEKPENPELFEETETDIFIH